MKVVVLANVDQREEILSKITKSKAELVFINGISETSIHQNADAFFILSDTIAGFASHEFFGKPVFINSVIETLVKNNVPLNFSRLNGWRGFLQREVWELASYNKEEITTIFEALGWQFAFVKDEPGLVAARVICMIINEAFFALEDGVSAVNEIDIAMKLGTNYPFGPFEWVEKIGVTNIYTLLETLAMQNKKYTPAPLLRKKFHELMSNSKA